MEFLAYLSFVYLEVTMHPVEASSEFMKETSPIKTVEIDQAGLHVSGWKSLIDMQIFFSG